MLPEIVDALTVRLPIAKMPAPCCVARFPLTALRFSVSAAATSTKIPPPLVAGFWPAPAVPPVMVTSLIVTASLPSVTDTTRLVEFALITVAPAPAPWIVNVVLWSPFWKMSSGRACCST